MPDEKLKGSLQLFFLGTLLEGNLPRAVWSKNEAAAGSCAVTDAEEDFEAGVLGFWDAKRMKKLRRSFRRFFLESCATGQQHLVHRGAPFVIEVNVWASLLRNFPVEELFHVAPGGGRGAGKTPFSGGGADPRKLLLGKRFAVPGVYRFPLRFFVYFSAFSGKLRLIWVKWVGSITHAPTARDTQQGPYLRLFSPSHFDHDLSHLLKTRLACLPVKFRATLRSK